MKWSEISDKDKVQHIIVDVLKMRMFESWKAAYDEMWKTGKCVPFGHPIAYWEEMDKQWRISYKPKETAALFDPLHDMNDAWKIMELDVFYSTSVVRSWIHKGMWICNLKMQSFHGTAYDAYGATAQEAICIASLMASGVEIEL